MSTLNGLDTSDATLRATFTIPILREAVVADGGIIDIESITLDDSFGLGLSGGSIGRVTQIDQESLGILLIDSSGGSSFRVEACAETTLVDISGGGSGTLVGHSDGMTTSLSGGSVLNAGSYPLQTLSFDLSGGSVIDVLVEESAEGDLSGGSIVELNGEADVDAKTSGGSIVQRQ